MMLVDVVVDRSTDVAAAYLGRQPVLDRDGGLVAYELLFRNSAMGGAYFADDAAATGQVIVNTIGEFGVCKVLGNHRAFINVGNGLLADDVLAMLSLDRFVLEIVETVGMSAATEQQCWKLRQAGYTLALDNVVSLAQVPSRVLAFADIVKVDLLAARHSELPSLVSAIHAAGGLAVAKKVETAADHKLASELGFDLFQGYFFARPELLAQRKLACSRSDLIALSAMLAAEPTIAELETAIKRNPPVLTHLMKMANNGVFGAGKPLSTIRDAILRVGTRNLMRWTHLLLYAGAGELPLWRNPLVQVIGTRARFIESAIRQLVPGDAGLADRGYQVGMFSLMHVLAAVSSDELMSQLAVRDDVRDAVSHRRGLLGNLLSLAEGLERPDQTTLDVVADAVPALTVGDVLRLNAVAAAWVAECTAAL
jgi:c-di-GMP-related signal transduction protein